MNEKLRKAIDEIDRMIEDSESIVDSGIYINARIETLKQVRNILARQFLSR